MSKSDAIRHRLLTVLVLGVIVSALSVTALVRLYMISTHQRVERARDEVRQEAERVARDPKQLLEPAAGNVVAMRAGIWAGDGAPDVIPAEWLADVKRAVLRTQAAHVPVVTDVVLGEARLAIAACPRRSGAPAWAALEVRASPALRAWQWIVALLVLATAVLVATTARAIVTVSRGAAELRGALARLATDLSAPIPRPRVRELSDVADGVALLAQNLARARQEEARLAKELSRQETLAALGRVTAGVAHEVRNPLASIKLRLDLAASSTPISDAVLAAISHASAEIDRLDRLVADLLIVAGRATGPQRPLSLGALVRARVDFLTPWAKDQGVAIRVSGDAAAHADPDSVARALDNLLKNAVEASAPGSSVEVAVRKSAALVLVEVRDSGSGVPAARAAELFEPFFTTKSAGMGLGLALSRSIARAHGGNVRYLREDAATVFELTLKADEPSEDAPDLEQSRRQRRQDGAGYPR